MNKRLRILHLEDDPDFSGLVRDLLNAQGIEVEVFLVENEADFDAALVRGNFDIILADFSLPTYTGIQALELAQAKSPQIPFLLVSGTIGEQAAIESLHAGATDYVLKQTPERLVPAVQRAVREAEERINRKRIEHQREALSKLSYRLSSVTAPKEAARVIQEVADELFGWDAFMLDLYSAETDLVTPLLNVDIIEGWRKEVVGNDHPRPPSGMSRRILQQGAELILLDAPAAMLPDSFPVGDTSRPSASLMLTPVRNAGKKIGVLSIQSYSHHAFTQSDLATLQVLADHCGGALERIRAEQSLRESDERFRDLFAGSPDAIFVEDLAGNVLDVNPAACQLHGLTREQLVGRNVADLVPPDRRADVLRDFQKLVEGWLSRAEGESVGADGRVTPVEVRASRIQYGGQPAVLLHVRDISERKHAETALRSSETLFRSVWENSVDGMRLTDENGTIIAVNKAYCNLVGMPRHDLEGKPFTAVYADAENPERMQQEYCRRVRDRVIERQVERRLTLRSGDVVVLENTNSYVELRGQSPLLLGLFRDVTAQKRLEDQLRQSQKMDAIGQLAGGVAHDFNNILTVIHGHASLLLAGANLPELPTRSAQQIVQAADRAAGLTRQLLTFSRRQVMQPSRLDLNDIVGNMTKMLDRILGEDIALQVASSPIPSLVQADASMMEQVVLNLAVNARDAMPRGGRLNLAIAITDVDERHVAGHPGARAGRFVCLTVSDTGCGISRENLPRIFEPFFTTKQVGKGTGLGLATVYGVARQHHGWVEVQSEVDSGSTFRVFIPCVGDAAVKREDKPVEPPVRGGTETILVVEDEPPVRELVCAILAGHGYKILQAESGVKALDVWKNHRDGIDLLLTDVVMPDQLNGWELAETLLSERPELKVIFTSGYSDDVVGKEFVMQQSSRFLQKPYEPRKLARIVRNCLDAGVAPQTPALQ